MESSDNNNPAGARRSGRVVKAPKKFSPEAQHDAPPKRKRGAEHDDEDDAENEEPDVDADEDESEAEADESADEDERAPRTKKARSSQAKKPAAKRPKVNGAAHAAGESAGASNGPAVRLPARPKKTGRVAIARRDGDGLYAEIFGSGDSSDDVAAHWFQRYQSNDTAAFTDLMNCVLLAAGCDQHLTEDDIRDPENSTNKLSELEGDYEQTNISDYPLISRAKSSKNFRELLLNFCDSLINLLHQTDVLYTDESLLENIQRWVGIMSSSALRPFRHTATTVGLSILTGFIEVMKQLDERISKTSQALQAEQNRRGKNKALVANTQKALDAATQNRGFIDTKVREFFDILFVHRYRDIDPKIRAECIEALGTWICTLPTVFMAPEYLRYLGWLLSDVAVSTRQEVLRQLGRILKRDAEKLAHFIDRFRPRLVEMATKDAEISVRVAAISVVDILRASGMLEPEEVDSVSKLLFDSEPRIRRAVVGFFAELVQEYVDNKVDEIGGSDAIDEVFGNEDDEDDYTKLRKDWINVKALAENLASYDAQLDSDQEEIEHGLDVAADVINAKNPESRISLAAQALFDKMPEIHNWQVIAGYLLFDHTTSSRSRSKSKANTMEAAMKKAVAPASREEAILIEVLATAVRESFSPAADHDRQKRRTGRPDSDAQEEAGIQLAAIIPQLLNKFGSDPTMTATIMKLEHYLDLDLFQQLRQNEASYDKLLDAITVQFKRHADQSVLNEAAAAFIHARQYEELEELTDRKLSELWENSMNALRNFDSICPLAVRGNIERVSLTTLGHVLTKINKLASVADCVDILEAPGTAETSTDSPIKILVSIVHRGLLSEADDELDDPEDEVVAFAIKCCLFYFMWKMRRLQKIVEKGDNVPNAEVDSLVLLRKEFITNITHTISTRGFNDDLRLMATGVLCDVGGLFAFLRPVVHGPQAPKYGKLRALLQELDGGLIPAEILPIFDAAERTYAKRAKKSLNDPQDDEDPIDDELPPEDDEDEELTEQERHAAELKAEKILCELTGKLVMGILAGFFDANSAGKLRKRLNRNKNKLGPNYKEVVAYLDEDHLRELRGGKKKPAKGKGKEAAKKPALSEALVIEDDHDQAEDLADPFEDDEPEEGTAEDLRRRELLEEEQEEEEEEDVDRPPEDMDEDSVIGD